MGIFMRRTGLRLASIIVFARATTAAGAVNVDYNTPGDLAGNFALNSGVAGLRFAEVPSGGLGGSRAIDIINALDADNTTAIYKNMSWDLSGPGSSVTVSQFALRRNGLLTNTPFLQLGVLSDTTERMDNDQASNSYASLILFPISPNTSTDVKAQYEYRVEGGSRQRIDVGATASLITGHWYRFAATFAYNTPTSLLFAGSLEDWGGDGSALQSTVLSISPTPITISGLNQVNGDSSVWAGYRGYQEGGSDLYDNFRAAPEPAGLSILVLAAGACRRRRTRR